MSFYSTSSATSTVSESNTDAKSAGPSGPFSSRFASPKVVPALFQQGPAAETVSIYLADCVTPAVIDFALGDTVCAKVTGAAAFQRRLSLVNPRGYIISQTLVSNDPQTQTYQIPSSQTSMFEGELVDNRGTWRVVSSDTSEGAARAAASFLVKDPQQPLVDLSVTKDVRGNGQVSAGDSLTFTVLVTNNGPDAASTVEMVDIVPTGTTFVSEVQTSGLPFTCTNPQAGGSGTTTCTIASLPKGAVAEFTLIYQVGAGAQPGAAISNTARVTSTTPERHTPDNNSTAGATVVSAATGGGESCIINCPEDVTKPADTTDANGNPGAIVHFTPPGGNDECGTILTSRCNDCFYPVGTTGVTATSSTGDSCSFTVTVTQGNNAPPTIQCPPTKTVTAAEGACSATVDPGTPITTGSNVTLDGERSDGQPLNAPYPSGTITIVWTATDDQGRTATCNQLVTVNTNDTTAPTITAPDNVNASTGNQADACGFIVGESQLGTATADDNCVTVNIARTGVPTGNFFPVGTTTITYTATDGAGNTASATQTVTVTDDAPPRIAAPDDANYTCASQVPAADPSQATRGEVLDGNGNPLPPGPPDDNCGGTPTVTVADTSSGAGSASSPLVITRTYTATDAVGNTASDSQIITVIDDTAPTVTAPADASYECASNVPAANAGDATASDNCGAPTVTVSDSSTGSGSTSSPLVITRTYTATDAAGNTASDSQTITVIDNTAPTVTAPADSSAEANGSCEAAVPNYAANSSVADNCDTSVTVTQSPAAGDMVGKGSHTVTVTATDDAGNTASDTVVFTVNDTTAPTITAPADVTANTGPGATSCDTVVTLGTASASDNCAGVTVTRSPSGNTFPVGDTDVVWTATDAAGNTASATQKVTVVDNTPPVVTPPANIVVQLPLNSSATSMAVSYPNPATATDNCAGAITISYSPASGSTFSVGTTTVTVSATDAHNNTATATFTVTVLYNFTGFFSPVGNVPTLNSVNAGRAIPVKFSLSGDKGLDIFAAGSPSTVSLDCSSSDPGVDVVETVNAGGSSLSFGGDQYVYVWKTESSWEGTCRQLRVILNDGSVHVANFKFK